MFTVTVKCIAQMNRQSISHKKSVDLWLYSN